MGLIWSDRHATKDPGALEASCQPSYAVDAARPHEVSWVPRTPECWCGITVDHKGPLEGMLAENHVSGPARFATRSSNRTYRKDAAVEANLDLQEGRGDNT